MTVAPTLFMRVAESQFAQGEAIVLPPESNQLDFEGEIAIVIGRSGGRLCEADVRDPLLFMKPGDLVEIEVDAIGVLRNTIEAETVSR